MTVNRASSSAYAIILMCSFCLRHRPAHDVWVTTASIGQNAFICRDCVVDAHQLCRKTEAKEPPNDAA